MNASRNIKIGALAVTAVALAAAGGAFAAAKHHGSKASASGGLSIGSYVSSQAGRTASGWRGGIHMGLGFGPGGDLAAAATYLGISQSDLQTDLQSGKTLAQVADATSGKSAKGLIDALVAAEQAELKAAVTANKLTQAQADQLSANLTTRITNLVNGTMPPRGNHGPGWGGRGPGGDLAAAATYLGISQSDLQTDLQSGKTLAQVADATSGKSAKGLIDALVAAEQAELKAAVTANKLTQAQADQLSANLTTRITNLVNGTMPPRGNHGPGWGGPRSFGGPGGFGGQPPSGTTLKPAGGTHI